MDTQAVVGPLPTTATDAGGRFSLEIEEAGVVRFSFQPPAESGTAGRFDVSVTLRPGRNAWDGDLQTGRLEGRVPVPAEKEAVFYNTAGDGGVSCWLTIVPDEEGRFVMPLVPVGAGRIVRYVETDAGLRQETLAEVEIRARETATVEIP